MRIFDKLLKAPDPAQVQTGKVVQIDAVNQRAQVRLNSGVTVWATYSKEEFPRLDLEQFVAVAVVGSSHVLIATAPALRPGLAELLVV